MDEHLTFRCCCGRPKEVHLDSPSDSNTDVTDGLIWDPEQHLETTETNAYGVVEFQVVATRSTAKV